MMMIDDNYDDNYYNNNDYNESYFLKKHLINQTVSYLNIGTVKTIELDHKELSEARPGKAVSVSIEPKDASKAVLLGRHFDVEDLMYSQVYQRMMIMI